MGVSLIAALCKRYAKIGNGIIDAATNPVHPRGVRAPDNPGRLRLLDREARFPGDFSQGSDPEIAARTGVSKAAAVGRARQRAQGRRIDHLPALGASLRSRRLRAHELALQCAGRSTGNRCRFGTARPLCLLVGRGNKRSRRRRHKARGRSDGPSGLLGLLVLTIASLYAFGHSGSPNMRAFASSARRTPSAAGIAAGAGASALPAWRPCAGN